MKRPFAARQLALLLVLAVALPFRTATAHPRLVRAVPAAGSHLTTAPREVSLTFNEAVTVALCRLTLLDATQHPVALDTLRAAPGNARTLTARILGKLPPGRYSVKWQAGGADGHPIRGEYTFVVDPGAGGLPTGAMATARPGGGAPFPGPQRFVQHTR